MGTKGARLTTFVALPSRLMVYMPRGEGIGVSARIEDEAERTRLKALVTEAMPQQTAAATSCARRRRAHRAKRSAKTSSTSARLWEHVEDRGLRARPGELVYEDLPLPRACCAMNWRAALTACWSTTRAITHRMLEFAAQLHARQHHEHRAVHRAAADLRSARRRRGNRQGARAQRHLKSGGHLVIDQTESMTTIDVNTGGFVGHRNLEDTIFRTNLEAAVAIARQLRLRNLGGIIIIDFIDMADAAHRTPGAGGAAARAGGRSRSDAHRERLLARPGGDDSQTHPRQPGTFAVCGRVPVVKAVASCRTPETVCHEIFREIVRQSRQFQTRELLILAHQNVVDRLLDEDSAVLAELEHQIGRPIRLQVEALYGFDQYDVVLA